MVNRLENFIKKSYLFIIFLFLYSPIVTLIIFSFNESKTMGKWTGFTLKWYKELENANLEDLEKWHFICGNTGIEWEELDCHLSIEAMLKSNANKVA